MIARKQIVTGLVKIKNVYHHLAVLVLARRLLAPYVMEAERAKMLVAHGIRVIVLKKTTEENDSFLLSHHQCASICGCHR
jgi:hypothetical protein